MTRVFRSFAHGVYVCFIRSLLRVAVAAAAALVTGAALAQADTDMDTGQNRPGTWLGELTWPEAEARLQRSTVVIVPIGPGAKEHGLHLPMNADAVVLNYLLDQAVANHDVIVAPPILHGWLPAFRDFPGTEVADAAVFTAYVQGVAESLVRSGAQRLLFLNTGIAKATGLPISIAAREIRTTHGVPTLVVSWDDLETEEASALAEQAEGGHSDEIETSINLYLQPELVKMDRAVTDYGNGRRADHGGYRPGFFSRDESDPGFSATGVYGDATLATREKGERVVNIMVAEWHDILERFSASPLRD